MLTREIPFLRIIIPLCLGIISGLYFSPGDRFFILSAITVLVLFSISLPYNRQMTNRPFGLSIMVSFFLCGSFLYTREKETLTEFDTGEIIITGHLSDYPEEKNKSLQLIVRMEGQITGDSVQRVKGSLLLWLRKSDTMTDLIPGDILVIRCIPLEIRGRGNPCEFNYRFYMENQGIRYYAYIDDKDILLHSVPARRNPASRALMIRERIICMFRERGLEGEKLALVAAITLGQKNMLDPEQKEHFIRAGVMHIMAVSGLHAVILSVFIFKLLFFLKGRLNLIRVIVTIVTLWIFAFITGLTPSVLRAALMYTFLQAGNSIRRPVNGINSVLASAFVLIMVRPSVIFDAGFQLSYSAVIYIILYYRSLYLKLTFRHRLPDLIWQSAAVTIVAQAGTLPLTIMLFNRFPTWFILSNIVIVPLSSLVVITGFLFPVLYPVVILSRLHAKILSFLTGFTERLTELASSLPLSSVENIGITTVECVLMIISVFMVARYLTDRKSISVIYPLSALLLFTSAITIRDSVTKRSSELVVFNSINTTTIGIRNGNRLDIISDSLPPGSETARYASVLNLKVRPVKPAGEMYCFNISGRKVLVSSTLRSDLLESFSPDIIIIRGTRPETEWKMKYRNYIEAVIISSEVSYPRSVQGSASALNAGKVHLVEEDGPFRLEL